MINRILIRMKVVQLLYSYLLTRSDFSIIPEPESHSRDKRYAYTLYGDLLLTLLDVSGFRIVNFEGRPRIEQAWRYDDRRDITAIASAISSDDMIKEIALRHKPFYEALVAIGPELRAAVRESSVYKEYQRKRDQPEIADEIKLWKTLFHSVILRNSRLQELLRSNPDFTHVGYEAGLAMLEETFDAYTGTRSALVTAKRDLTKALDKSYELYMDLLLLMVEITDTRASQLDEAKHKYVPTHDDLNPNTRFVDNRLIAALRENPSLTEYVEENKLSWENSAVMVRRLTDRVVASKEYGKYMEIPNPTWDDDCELWYNLMRYVVLPGDELAEELEAQSIYWNDDLDIMGSFVLKTIRGFRQGGQAKAGDAQLSPKYKDLEDERFGPRLFEDVIRNRVEYRAIIDAHLAGSSWEPERVAFMDVVILSAAIAELLCFESIPAVVTVNEYTEIANFYSTAKSGSFVTGILYSIIADLKKEGRIVKD